MLACILLRQDAGSGFVQPLVATGVVEVPVGVYQLFDGVLIDACEGFGNVRTRGDDFRVDEQLSVRAGKNGNISTRTQKNADIAAEALNRDFRCGGFLERRPNQAVRLGEQPSWNKRSHGDRATCSSKKLPP